MFLKREWFGRRGKGLNKFSIDGADPVEVVNAPDNVTEQGDAFDESNMNDLENRIRNAELSAEASISGEVSNRQSGDSGVESFALDLIRTATYSASSSQSSTIVISVSAISGYTPIGVIQLYIGTGYFYPRAYNFDANAMTVTVTGLCESGYTGYNYANCKIMYVKNSV